MSLPTQHLAISIVSHPNGDLQRHVDLLDQCLASLHETIRESAPRIILTNNLAQVPLFQQLSALTGDEELITNEQPQGFAANHNRIVQGAPEPYVLILNDDTVVLEGAVERLVAELEANPRAAVVGPRIFTDLSRQEVQPSAGARVMTPERALLWRLLRETPLIGRPGLSGLYAELDEAAPAGEVLHLQGACLLVRREAYLQVGGMDEEYGMYREETDLCLALKQEGWQVRFCPEAKIVHFGGASTGNVTYREQYQRSLDRFLRRHYGWRATLVNGLIQPPLLGAARLLRGLVRLVRRR